MTSEELTQAISDLLDSNGLSTTEIAEKLNLDRAIIDSHLYKHLGTVFFQDNHYRWYLRSNYLPKKSKKVVNTSELSRLSRYYLQCLDQTDDSGYSCFAESKYGSRDYIDVRALPTNNQITEFGINELKSKMRREKSRTEIFFGYPIKVKRIMSKKSSWEGFIVEPILIYSMDEETGGLSLIDELPVINSSVIKGESSFASSDDYVEEIVQLEEELGLNNGIAPNLPDIAQRLMAIRPSWKWIDKIEPYRLNDSIKISDITKEGIYNKGLFFLSARSPFTKGLETELSQLATMTEETLKDTALGKILNNKWLDRNNIDNGTNTPILEPIPLNLEQRLAVTASLNNDLTVVTGPPGTGKSQLITNLIINAIWRGKTVLFASKNNKAVDIVDIRVNSISKRDVLIRTGSSKYQHRLSEFLITLLNYAPTELDREEFSFQREKYDHIVNEEQEIDLKISNFIELRNKTDLADIKVQKIKLNNTFTYIRSIISLDISKIEPYVVQLKNIFRKLDPKQQSILDKLTLPFSKKNKLIELKNSVNKLKSSLGDSFNVDEDADLLVIARNYISTADLIISDRKAIYDYRLAYKELIKTDPLEKLSKEKLAIHKELVNLSTKLWDLAVKLMPDKLSAENRNMVNRYKSLLEMIRNSDVDIYNDLGKDAYFQYKKLTEETTRFLPAWAVTSLSARGKIPFEGGMFDLVIFDEASQCDIASALPLLYRAKQAVVIGDPRQLKHITSLDINKDEKLLNKNDLFLSHPNWAYSFNSLFDLASGLVGPSGLVRLRDHHRSHAEIINFSNEYFYEGTLRVATRYDKLVSVDGKSGVDWIDVSGGRAERPSNGSAFNKVEATKVYDIVKNLLINKNYQGTLGVVTPFRAQADYIEELVYADSKLLERLSDADFKVDTVHRFQGDERDVIIFSPVLTRGASEGSIGFMKNNGNLFNVAITRARARLLIVGDRSYASVCEVSYLQKFAEYTKTLERNRTTKESSLINYYGASYPKLSTNTEVSDWEKILYEALFAAKIKSIPQYSIDAYVLDLAVISKDKRRLDIEVDGEMYHRNWTGELSRRDELRNQRMFELGWDVKRFWVYEVRDDLDRCVAEVKAWLINK